MFTADEAITYLDKNPIILGVDEKEENAVEGAVERFLPAGSPVSAAKPRSENKPRRLPGRSKPKSNGKPPGKSISVLRCDPWTDPTFAQYGSVSLLWGGLTHESRALRTASCT